ncbi:MAG: Gfo/Idh/MocA family oxidoreductase [Candidatus Omnitrophica bacterium]|nr:Gfo/Idh/MocA family oxidoreductase [Candidatus Omnitrophota bacterium]
MKLKLLIVGAGMYVCGRGTDGFGTVLPSLYEAYRCGLIERVDVIATRPASIQGLMEKNNRLNERMGFGFPVHGHSGADAYRRALKEIKPDCVIISVPDHLHARVAIQAANAGSHVLVVKPLAPTAKEAKEMIQAAQKNQVYGAVEFHKRFDDANLKIRDMFSQGKLGDLLYIVVNYSQRKIIPQQMFKDWSNKTNIFQYLGVHYADLIYFVTGAKPIRVMATGQKQWLTAKGIATHDAIQVVIEWSLGKKEFTSIIATNWIDPNTSSAMSDQKISLVGTKGRIDSDQKNRGVQIVTDENGIEDFNPYFSQLYTDTTGQTVFRGYGERSIHQFLRDVSNIKLGVQKPKDLRNFRPTFEQGLVSTAIIEAVGVSLKKNNVWVNVRG